MRPGSLSWPGVSGSVSSLMLIQQKPCLPLSRENFIRLGLYSSETAELSLRDYGGQLCLLTHCSIPSGLTGKQRPAVPLVVTCLKSRGPVAPPVGATQRTFSSSGAGGPRSHIRQGAYQCVSKGCCCSDDAWFALRWEGLLSRAMRYA